ncbi:hypothetical protein IWQ51_004238 [Labrenzia sp. EL_142]|nr:hypothetical protein [Labrenzia sp. EL_142]
MKIAPIGLNPRNCGHIFGFFGSPETSPHAFSSMPMRDRQIEERDLTSQPTKCRLEKLPDVYT